MHRSTPPAPYSCNTQHPDPTILPPTSGDWRWGVARGYRSSRGLGHPRALCEPPFVASPRHQEHYERVLATTRYRFATVQQRLTPTAVKRADPSLVIHAEYAKDRAAIVDATAHVVASACEVDADIVVISADAVFSGDGIARDEGSDPDPGWSYGRGKQKLNAVRLCGQPPPRSSGYRCSCRSIPTTTSCARSVRACRGRRNDPRVHGRDATTRARARGRCCGLEDRRPHDQRSGRKVAPSCEVGRWLVVRR